MNDLNSAGATTFASQPTLTRILSREEHLSFKDAWRTQFAAGRMTAADFILHAVLCGRDPQAGFSPVTNSTKLANGQRAWQGYDEALRSLRVKGYLALRLPTLCPSICVPGWGVTRFHEVLDQLTAAIGGLKTQGGA